VTCLGYELWKYELNLFMIVSSVEFCKKSVEHLLSETLVTWVIDKKKLPLF
jgi:hypothetical protein